MKALFIIINHEEHFRKLLKEFAKTGIRGGTIISSEGLAASQAEYTPELGMNYFKMFINSGRPYNKTIFLVLDDNKIEDAKDCVRRVVGNLDRENVGIMFTCDVDSFEGLTK
ncbi:hypothetical protein [Peptoniphilus raoultii]|uniref:hypothetical protein n=1 Tax=Peptoniphilus raoultii TaxID=1776387 RepID=UPI0008D98591|nr:hypothetical protein [Peptoniphilus raoultii]